jgi:heterotetrameric sarcosine oxidase gamma subunit
MPETHSPVARTPLHSWHEAHGGRFIERDGWQLVATYASADSEAAAVGSGLGAADISAFAKVSLRGSGVSALAASLVPDSAALHPRGVAPIPGESALACRLTDDHLLLLASTPALPPLTQRLPADRAIVQVDVTSTYAGFLLIGPHLEGVLRRLTHLDVSTAALPVNSCAETILAGVEALLVRGEARSLPVLRLYVAWDVGEYVWERILQAGAELPITLLSV